MSEENAKSLSQEIRKIFFENASSEIESKIDALFEEDDNSQECIARALCYQVNEQSSLLLMGELFYQKTLLGLVIYLLKKLNVKNLATVIFTQDKDKNNLLIHLTRSFDYKGVFGFIDALMDPNADQKENELIFNLFFTKVSFFEALIKFQGFLPAGLQSGLEKSFGLCVSEERLQKVLAQVQRYEQAIVQRFPAKYYELIVLWPADRLSVLVNRLPKAEALFAKIEAIISSEVFKDSVSVINDVGLIEQNKVNKSQRFIDKSIQKFNSHAAKIVFLCFLRCYLAMVQKETIEKHFFQREFLPIWQFLKNARKNTLADIPEERELNNEVFLSIIKELCCVARKVRESLSTLWKVDCFGLLSLSSFYSADVFTEMCQTILFYKHAVLQGMMTGFQASLNFLFNRLSQLQEHLRPFEASVVSGLLSREQPRLVPAEEETNRQMSFFSNRFSTPVVRKKRVECKIVTTKEQQPSRSPSITSLPEQYHCGEFFTPKTPRSPSLPNLSVSGEPQFYTPVSSINGQTGCENTPIQPTNLEKHFATSISPSKA